MILKPAAFTQSAATEQQTPAAQIINVNVIKDDQINLLLNYMTDNLLKLETDEQCLSVFWDFPG